MKKSVFYFKIFLLIFVANISFAQNTVRGKVSESNGDPLLGVSIKVKGTNAGTITGADGNYTVIASPGSVLTFSYIGYKSQDVTVGSSSNVNVSMEEDASSLSEVVVTAFGISKDKRVLSYATQNIETKTFAQARELNVANSLAGRVAGLDIVRSSSGVGGSSRVVLRGDRSLNQGKNSALIILDGVIMDNSNFSAGNANGGRDGGDGLSSVNPDDIESLNVLRGAAASALYGAGASNGALIINTKKGGASKNGGIGVSLNTSYIAESPMILQKFQNQYGQGSAGIYNRASEANWGPKLDGASVAEWGPTPGAVGKTYGLGSNPDNYRDFYSTGNQLSNSLSFSGGSEKARTYVSFTNVGAQGIVNTNKLNRNIFNARINGDITSKWSYDTKVTYLNENIKNRMQTGENYANPQRHILRIPRNITTEMAENYEYIDPVTGQLKQNYWNPGSNGGQNPYWIKNNVKADDVRDRLNGFLALTYKVAPSFSVMARAGVDQYVDKFEGKWNNNTYIIADNGDYQSSWREIKLVNLDLLGFYKKQFGENFEVDATIGATKSTSSRIDQFTLNGGLNRDNLFIHSNSRSLSSNRALIQKEKQGVFATSDFTYKGFLTLTGSLRNDWASTLPKANRSYLYPAVGMSAIVSEMLQLPSQIDFLKVRASYANVGNDTDPYLLVQTFSFLTGGANGFIVRDNTKPFENLKPEITAAKEIGFEMKFLKNRLGFDLGFYSSDTKNQLIRLPLPQSSGWSFEFVNAGLVNNRGTEITMNINPVQKANFRWDVDLNYARNRNKLVELTPNVSVINGTSDFMNFTRSTVGNPLGDIFSKGYQRNTAGQIIVDANGLPLITPGTTVYLGNTRAAWSGGINNRVSYKNLSLSALISARVGGVVSSFTNAVIYADGIPEQTLAGRESFVFEGVKETIGADKVATYAPNTTATNSEKYWLRVGGRNSPAGEVFTYSATNIRLRELVFSYSIPTDKMANTPFKRASVSLTGRNLFFFKNGAVGFDPELTSGSLDSSVGLESFSLPSTRTYGVNLNLSF